MLRLLEQSGRLVVVTRVAGDLVDPTSFATRAVYGMRKISRRYHALMQLVEAIMSIRRLYGRHTAR